MKPFLVRLFERRPPRPMLHLPSSDWHGPASQERTCLCGSVMIEGTGRLWLGKYCGRCALELDLIPPDAA